MENNGNLLADDGVIGPKPSSHSTINSKCDSRILSKLFSFCKSITIEPCLVLLFIAEFMADPVVTNLILLRTCEVEFHFNKADCDTLNLNMTNNSIEETVQPYVSTVVLAKSLVGTVFPAFLSFFMGPWSDYNGRRPLILLPLLGYSLKYVLLTVFSAFSLLHPYYLLLAIVPQALSGGLISVCTGVFCYISDITKEEERSIRLGLLEGLIFLSVFIGSISSSVIYTAAGKYGFFAVFSLSASLGFCGFLYTLFFVPESIQQNEEKGNRISFSLIREMFAAFFRRREDYRRVVLIFTVIALTATIASMEGQANVGYLFARVQFHWTFKNYMLWSSMMVVFTVIGTIFGIFVLMKILKIPDSVLNMGVYVTKCCQCILYAFAPSNASYLMYVGAVIASLGGVTGPLCRSIISKSVEPEELGKIFSLTSALEALFPIAVTPLYTVVYNYTIDFLPGAFFLISALIYFSNFVFFCIIIWLLRSCPLTYHRLSVQ